MSRFSILTPVYRPPEKALQAMLASVARQSLGDWEHCLVDDHSGDPAIRELLDAAAAGDPRVQVRYRDRQGGIVATTNDALAMATGDYVAFLDHDDELSPGALEAMAAAIEQHPGVDYLYSDEDKIDAKGRHFRPFLKPGWSPDRLRSQMYMAHFRVIRRGLVEELGGLRSGFDGSQDWELALRIAERSNRIVHVPEILYHWRTAPGSAAGATEAKPWAHEAALRAVREHIGRSAVAASVERVPDVPGHFWLRPALTSHPPVSIVIASSQPSEAGGASLGCIERLLARSSYDNFELVVAVGAEAEDGGSDRLRELVGERLKLLRLDPGLSLTARLNSAVEASEGEQLVLLGEQVEVLRPEDRPVPKRSLGQLPRWPTADAQGREMWIEEMLVFSMQAGVGSVGAKLFRPDGRLQEAGIAWHAGRPARSYQLQPGDGAGYLNNLLIPRNCLAVSAACMMTPRAAFDDAGGMDPGMPPLCSSVDYCLKLREAGLRTVFAPQVEMVDRGPLPAGELEAAGELLRERWPQLLRGDPFYSPRFAGDSFELRPFNRRGEFQDRVDPLALVDRVRRAFGEGGVRLVVGRTYGKVRHELGQRSRHSG